MQHRPKNVDKCVFCGAPGPLTKEDVIPRWVAEVFRANFNTKGVLFTKSVNIQGESTTSRPKKYGSASVFKLIALCETCNTSWMKDIENGVINSVTEMILGRSVVLNPDVIERIATWATLKALCFDLIAESPRFSSDEDFVRLHTQKSPAPGLLVWTAQYEGDPNDFGQFSVLPSFDDVDERQRAHSFKLYLVLGAFALDITFTPLAKISAGPMHGRPVESGYYKALWPMSADLSWPPPLSLNSESYAVFSRQDLYPPILRKQ